MKSNVNESDLEVMTIPGVQEVGLEIRHVGKREYLFTTDGKLVSGQIKTAGHNYYIGQPPNNTKTFRTTFLVDGRGVSTNSPIELPATEE